MNHLTVCIDGQRISFAAFTDGDTIKETDSLGIAQRGTDYRDERGKADDKRRHTQLIVEILLPSDETVKIEPVALIQTPRNLRNMRR